MFTGIVTAIGTIESIEERGDLRVRITCPWDPATIDIGAAHEWFIGCPVVRVYKALP